MFITLAADGDHTLAQLTDLASNPLVWSTILTVLIIPLLNGALTRPNSPKWFKALLTAVLAGIFAVVANLVNLGDVGIDWPATLAVFVIAAAGAGGINAAIVGGPVADKLGLKVPINVGPKPITPEKAAAIHSSSSGLTEVAPAEANGVVSDNPIDPETWSG